MTHSCKRGFTLMEMLLVSSLSAMIGLAVFNAFSNGLKLWERSFRLDAQGQVLIGLTRMEDDVRRTLSYSQIPFKGTGQHFSFAAIVRTAADKKGSFASEGIVDQIGAVEYRFDPAEGRILRRQANYSQALRQAWGPDQEAASGIEDVSFHYYFADDRGLKSRSQTDQAIPCGIDVELRLRNSTQVIRKYFAIPVGG